MEEGREKWGRGVKKSERHWSGGRMIHHSEGIRGRDFVVSSPQPRPL